MIFVKLPEILAFSPPLDKFTCWKAKEEVLLDVYTIGLTEPEFSLYFKESTWISSREIWLFVLMLIFFIVSLVDMYTGSSEISSRLLKGSFDFFSIYLLGVSILFVFSSISFSLFAIKSDYLRLYLVDSISFFKISLILRLSLITLLRLALDYESKTIMLLSRAPNYFKLSLSELIK